MSSFWYTLPLQSEIQLLADNDPGNKSLRVQLDTLKTPPQYPELDKYNQ